MEEALELGQAFKASKIDTASVVEPWLCKARQKLGNYVRALAEGSSKLHIGGRVIRGLSKSLEDDLRELAIRPVLLEAEIAERSARCDSEYYTALCRLSGSNAKLALYAVYPGLALAISQACAQWLAASEEFLTRLSQDLRELQNCSLVRDGAGLRAATFAKGDLHDCGRRVAIAQFSDGTGIVYKPRPLQSCTGYQILLRWLNQQGFAPQFKTISVLDRGTWGWLELVDPESCTDRGALGRFYKRLGGQLAALRLLGTTDCHHENLIAAGEHPVLIDLETMLAPILGGHTGSGSDEAAKALIADSVLSTGLLPSPSLVDGKLVDLSGYGARSHQETPLESFSVRPDADGRLRVAYGSWKLGRIHNRPRLKGKEVDPTDFLADFEAGFRIAYDLIVRGRDELFSSDGPLQSFKGAEIRVVLRPTSAYSSILRDSRHPNAMYDGVERDRILSQLWLAPKHQPRLLSVVKAEFAQLRRGDIPIFRGTADGVNIAVERNAPPLLIGRRSGLQASKQRLKQMGPADRSVQVDLLRSSVQALQKRKHRLRRGKTVESPQFLAQCIGEQLLASSIQADSEATWLVRREPDCSGPLVIAQFS